MSTFFDDNINGFMMKPELKESELIINIDNKMNTSQDVIPTSYNYS